MLSFFSRNQSVEDVPVHERLDLEHSENWHPYGPVPILQLTNRELYLLAPLNPPLCRISHASQKRKVLNKIRVHNRKVEKYENMDGCQYARKMTRVNTQIRARLSNPMRSLRHVRRPPTPPPIIPHDDFDREQKDEEKEENNEPEHHIVPPVQQIQHAPVVDDPLVPPPENPHDIQQNQNKRICGFVVWITFIIICLVTVGALVLRSESVESLFFCLVFIITKTSKK